MAQTSSRFARLASRHSRKRELYRVPFASPVVGSASMGLREELARCPRYGAFLLVLVGVAVCALLVGIGFVVGGAF
jgi:hypothetical protein